jgi:predicted AAA+ superfamily ATPase
MENDQSFEDEEYKQDEIMEGDLENVLSNVLVYQDDEGNTLNLPETVLLLRDSIDTQTEKLDVQNQILTQIVNLLKRAELKPLGSSSTLQ